MTTPQEFIKTNVVDQLAWDTRVLATDVIVEVEGRTVTLSGTVGSHLSRRAAVEDASRIAGVSHVIDRLGVRHPDVVEIPTDQRVQSNVENILAWNQDVDIADVSISVTGGVVTLEGTVDAYWKKPLAEDLVLGLSGVVGVENRLTIVPTADLSDQVVAEEIMKSMERRQFINPDLVDITVENGLVTLEGSVPNYVAEENAFDAARYTSGVQAVRNQLAVMI